MMDDNNQSKKLQLNVSYSCGSIDLKLSRVANGEYKDNVKLAT